MTLDQNITSPVYVRSQEDWSDTSPSFGLYVHHICKTPNFEDCGWLRNNRSSFDTYQWGNDCDRWFTDYFGTAGECYPGEGPDRCFTSGVACEFHKVIRNVVISKL